MRAVLAPALLVLALSGCGGGDQPPPVATQVAQAPQATATATPAATQAQAAPPQATATTAATTAPTSAPSAAPTQAAAAAETPTPDPAASKSTPAPTATPLPKDAPTATPTPTPKPANKNGPLICLTAAKLKETRKSGAGLWSGTLGGPEALVAVDGPYPSPRDAQLSVESLAGVSNAEVGGNYVVSASLATKAQATVHKVADCLDARDS